MSKLLMNEKPLMVMPLLAAKIGLNEALFLQQLHYWLERSANIEDGHRWVYNTAKEWQKQFPFWSVSTIRRITGNLEDKCLIITGSYNKSPIDKTLWYRIDYAELDNLENEEKDESRNRESSSQNEHSTTQSEHSKYPERPLEVANVNTPIPESTTESTSEIYNYDDNAREQRNSINLIDLELKETIDFYESQGFGPIPPIIGGKMTEWIRDLSKDLVIHAMTLTIENGANSWNYVETILRSWSKKGYKTVSEIEAVEKKRKQQQAARSRSGKKYGPPACEEHVPDWFDKKKSSEAPAAERANSVDIAEERRRLMAELGVEKL